MNGNCTAELGDGTIPFFSRSLLRSMRLLNETCCMRLKGEKKKKKNCQVQFKVLLLIQLTHLENEFTQLLLLLVNPLARLLILNLNLFTFLS